MPDPIRGILLIPHDDAMLADGPCGSMAPTAWTCTVGGCVALWQPSGRKYCAHCGGYAFSGRALALAWDGKPIPQALGWLPEANVDHEEVSAYVNAVMRGGSADAGVLLGLLSAAVCELGTIIAVDGDGREVWGG